MHIVSLHPSAFIIDDLMIKKYKQLKQKAATPLPSVDIGRDQSICLTIGHNLANKPISIAKISD